MNDYGSETYNALIKIVKIRFAKELKDSGIQLQGFYSIKDLASNKEFFLLKVNNMQFRFVDEKGFLVFFTNFIEKNIAKLKTQHQYLIKRPTDEFSDAGAIEYEYKQLEYYIFKQKQLVNKLVDYKQEKYK